MQVELSNDVAPGGGTIIGAGSVVFIGNGATGSLSGPIANSGVVGFNRSNTLVYSDVISGTGSKLPFTPPR